MYKFSACQIFRFFKSDAFFYFIFFQAMRRQQSAGLGSRGSNYHINPGDSYKDSLKKVMYARYQEME